MSAKLQSPYRLAKDTTVQTGEVRETSASIRPKLVYDDNSSPTQPRLPLPPTLSNEIKPVLSLNQISDDELVHSFQFHDGLGLESAVCIVNERKRSGRFVDQRDFNRRVHSLSFSRLTRIFDVSFAGIPPARLGSESNSRWSGVTPEDVCVDLNSLQLSKTDAVDVVEADTVVFATWNCAQMSPRSLNFQKKCQTLERLILDTPNLDVVVLQEIYANSAAQLMERLRATLGRPLWTAIGCGSQSMNGRSSRSHTHSRGSSCQVALYNASRVRCITHCYVDADVEDEVLRSYQRPPHVCVFERITRVDVSSQLLVMATCHVSYTDPRREIIQLPSLLRAMELACARSLRRGREKGLKRTDVTYVLAGDFNRNSNSPDFDMLREEGFVELVAPRCTRQTGRGRATAVLDAEMVNNVDFIRDETTSGGQHYDNVFVHRSVRESDLSDAWVYIPGGTGKRLRESGRASAARARGERSDHRPIVVQLRLRCAAVDNQSQSQHSQWRLQNEFVVRSSEGSRRNRSARITF